MCHVSEPINIRNSVSRDRFKSLWAGSIVAKSIAICSSVLLNNLFYINVHLFIVFISCVIGASPTVMWLTEVKRNHYGAYVHGTFLQ